jgi:serine/threonine protein phosphatase PrpC
MQSKSFGFSDPGKIRSSNERKIRIDTFLTDIFPKDLYLICTDGLYEILDDSEIL